MISLARQNLILGTATAGALGVLAIVMLIAARSETTTVNVIAPTEPVGTTTITSFNPPTGGATNETLNASAPGGAPASVATPNLTNAPPREDVNVNIYMSAQPQSAPPANQPVQSQSPAQPAPMQSPAPAQAPAQSQPSPLPYAPAPAPTQPAPPATPSASSVQSAPPPPPTVTPPGVSTSPPAGVPTDEVPSQPYYP